MCGLAGLVDFARPATVHAGALSAMQRALRHRGPDGAGTWARGPCGVTHVRLSIVDHDGGAQPAVSADGRHVLVFDGEVYNHAALRRELADAHRFETRCDTEVVLAACRQWGEAALHRLDGMFSLFFWDAVEERGFAARDPLGVKPLLHASRDGRLAFASEAKALLAADLVPVQLDAEAFARWLVMPAYSGVLHSPFEDVAVLPAGGLLRVARDGARTDRWVSAATAPPAVPTDPSDLVSGIADELRRSVHACARADVPVGTLLSGGVDSTAVTALAAEVRPGLPAWCVRFDGRSAFDDGASAIVREDDAPHAQAAARAVGADLRWVDVRRQEVAADLRAVARHQDALPAWEQELAQHRLFRAAREAATPVVLVGDAADETHWGYDFLLDEETAGSPLGPLRRFGARRRAAFLAPRLARELEPLRLWEETARTRAADRGLDWSDRACALRATDLLIRELWLGRLLHSGDLHAMAHGVEARVPYASAGLIALASRVPPELGLERGRCKAVLRRAAPATVPAAIRWRRKSALPKPPRAATTYRAELARALEADAGSLDAWWDVAALRRLCAHDGPADEVATGLLFQAACFAHFAAHHGIA